MAIIYIGIGSNLGSREENCLEALRLISAKVGRITKRSSMHETEPWGVLEQPKFINMVVEAESGLEPPGLLRALKEIEDKIGREETYRWGPRIIDLDILFYDDLVIDTPELKIPHPLIHEREFILKPLSEITPDKVHPVLKKTVKELLAEVQGK